MYSEVPYLDTPTVVCLFVCCCCFYTGTNISLGTHFGVLLLWM